MNMGIVWMVYSRGGRRTKPNKSETMKIAYSNINGVDNIIADRGRRWEKETKWKGREKPNKTKTKTMDTFFFLLICRHGNFNMRNTLQQYSHDAYYELHVSRFWFTLVANILDASALAYTHSLEKCLTYIIKQ